MIAAEIAATLGDAHRSDDWWRCRWVVHRSRGPTMLRREGGSERRAAPSRLRCRELHAGLLVSSGSEQIRSQRKEIRTRTATTVRVRLPGHVANS
jgi:hypothetical protein